MAKETRSWEANDGSLHKTACDAARRDLELIISDSPCAENGPYAKKMLEWMSRSAREIAHALTEYDEACPKPVDAKPTLEAVDAKPTLEAVSDEIGARRAGAIGEMQEMAQGPDKNAVKEWLRRYGFENLPDFNARAGFDDVTAWNTFVAQHEDRRAAAEPYREISNGR